MPRLDGLKLVCNEYDRVVKSKLEDIESEIEQVRRNRKLYEQLILRTESKVYPNNVITAIKNHKIESGYHRHKINKMFANLMYSRDNRHLATIELVPNHDEEGLEILSQYSNFKEFATREALLETRYELYSSIALSERTLKYLFNTMLKFGARYIFETGERLSLPHNILLRIKGKRRKIKERMDKFKSKFYMKKKIDWNESMKTLIAIGEELAPELTSRYNERRINKREFIQEMKPYVYNKDTNPDGKRWLVDDNKEHDFWLVIDDTFCNLDGMKDYKIEPSNYISPKVVNDLGIPRKQSEFMKTVTCVHDIIDTEYLGMRDKIMMLEKYDLDYCLKTFNNDI